MSGCEVDLTEAFEGNADIVASWWWKNVPSSKSLVFIGNRKKMHYPFFHFGFVFCFFFSFSSVHSNRWHQSVTTPRYCLFAAPFSVHTGENGATVKIPVVQRFMKHSDQQPCQVLKNKNLCPIFRSLLKLHCKATVTVKHMWWSSQHPSGPEPAASPTCCRSDPIGMQCILGFARSPRVSLWRIVTSPTYKSNSRRGRPLSKALKTGTPASIMSC